MSRPLQGAAQSAPAAIGWGGRDRTYECRNQNPVPYHLATPQRNPANYRAKSASGWRASVRASASFDMRAECDCSARLRLAPLDAKAANTHAPEPVIRAPRCGNDASASRHRRDTAAAVAACKVVAAVTLGKDVHFRRRRRSCQFRRRENIGRAHVRARQRERNPRSGQRDRRQRARRCRARARSRRRRRTARRRPASCASAASRSRGQSSRHSRLSASSTRRRHPSFRRPGPRPAGCAFRARSSTPSRTPAAVAQRTRRAQRQVIVAPRRPATSAVALDLAVRCAARASSVSAEIDQREDDSSR